MKRKNQKFRRTRAWPWPGIGEGPVVAVVVEVSRRGGRVKVVMILRWRMEKRRTRLLESVGKGVCNVPDDSIGGGVFGWSKGYVGNGIAHHIILYRPI